MKSKKFRANLITYAIVIAAFIACQVLISTGVMTRSLKGQLVPICAYIVMAISLNLTVGISGELSLGHAGFMSVGAFSGIVMSMWLSKGMGLDNKTVVLLLAIITGGVAAGIAGVLIGIPVLRLRGDYLAIVTLAFGEIIRNVINCLYISLDGSKLHVAFNNPNVAGKTTVFNLLTKVYQPTMGTILLNGRDTAGMNTAQANKLGIARTFQNIRLFGNMSVEDNVRIGLHNQVRYGMIPGIFRMPGYWRGEREMHERALDLLSIFDMQDLANHQAGSLPYGAQRRLEIVCALATNPSLLLLDEPAAGMNPHETEELMENITKIRDQFHIAILLIEHDMSLVMGICEGICVLNYGKIIAKGTAEEIQNNPVVIEAYLGKRKEN